MLALRITFRFLAENRRDRGAWPCTVQETPSWSNSSLASSKARASQPPKAERGERLGGGRALRSGSSHHRAARRRCGPSRGGDDCPRAIGCDLRRRLLTVSRSDWHGHVTSPKGGRSRAVPMTEKVAAALSAHRHLRGARVLYRSSGEPLSQQMLRTLLSTAQKRQGLPPPERCTSCGTRSARTWRCETRRRWPSRSSPGDQLAHHASVHAPKPGGERPGDSSPRRRAKSLSFLETFWRRGRAECKSDAAAGVN